VALGLMSLARLARAGIMRAREGAFAEVDPTPLPAGARMALRSAKAIQRRRQRSRGGLTAALNRLGPSYVKLGQFLATRPDLVGRELSDELGQLRDEMEAFSMAEASSTIARSLGRDVGDLFTDFSAPVAAASIAQVHAATLTEDDGGTDAPARKVAVKVVRPGVRDRFQRDLASFYAAARLVERIDPAARRLRPVAVVDTLARSVAIEMDFRLEGAALSEMAELIAEDEGFRVPEVVWGRTSRDVLTMSWVDGIKLSDVDSLRDAGHDLPAIAKRLMQAFLRQALRDGFFHADMHQGNFFVDSDGAIVAIDFGIMGRLGRLDRRFLAEVLYGFITGDYRRVAQVHFDAGIVPEHHGVEEFAQALRAIGEPILGQPAKDISMGRLLMLLFEVTDLFDMQTRPELLLLQKTMVVVEGVARSLDSDFDMWSTSEPIVRAWIERNLGPTGQLERAAEGLVAVGRLAGELPKLAERAERLAMEFDEMTRDGLRLDTATIDRIGRGEARSNRWGHVALWVIAGALLFLVAQII